jgi:DNA replication ATP-dependent helicase Dna2
LDEEALAHGQGWEPSTESVAAIRRFLEQEHNAQNAGREAMYDAPVEDRVKAGLAIDRAFASGVEAQGRRKLFLFHSSRNDSRFRPGTRLRLSRGNPREAVAVLELVEDRYDGKKYEFRLSGQLEDETILESSEPWVLDEDIFDLLDAQLGILREAEEQGLADWLEGGEPSGDPDSSVPQSAFAEGLPASMAAAFEGSARTRAWYAVQGPPGSGKTHLLARLALHFAVEKGLRVLITAVAHQAIHHALRETYFVGKRFLKENDKVRSLLADGFLKIGGSRGRNEGLPAGVRPVFRLPKSKKAFIAGATVYAARNAAQELGGPLPFDVVLFDEAGQAPLVLALGARLLAEKAVFIGDDMQLPPVIQSADDEDGDPSARRSAIELVREVYGDPPMIAETRRLNDSLCAVVSDCFYDGALAPTAEAGARRLSLGRPPGAGFEDVFDPEEPLVFVDVPHEDQRSKCEAEARWAAAVVGEAARLGLAAEEIGVISPYRAQCNRIRFLCGARRGLTVSTVERFQGQERELVVISLTSSQLRYMARLAGFLFNQNRLNVAVSRARTKVVILGSRKALRAAMEAADEGNPDSPAAAGLSTLQRILENACEVDGARVPVPVPVETPVAAAGEASAFEPGDVVEHADFGAGIVSAKTQETVDGRPEWVNEVRFDDGSVRMVIPRLSDPPMKKAT